MGLPPNEYARALASSVNRTDHNNFINNTKQVYNVAFNSQEISTLVNVWHEGGTGNYWSDYNGTGPYVFYENNQDKFPTNHPLKFSNQSRDLGH